MYNEIEAVRFQRMLQKFFGIRGSAPVRQLAGEVATMFPLFNGVENRYLEGWERFGWNASQAGAAGVSAGVRWRNPLNSAVIAVFEKLMVWNTLADQPSVQIGPTSLDLTSIQAMSVSRLDSRSRPTPTLIFSTSNTVTQTLTQLQAAQPANSTVDFILFEEQELTLLAGDALTVKAGQNNQQINVAGIWRERLLEDSEVR